jgi:hypothetical protein
MSRFSWNRVWQRCGDIQFREMSRFLWSQLWQRCGAQRSCPRVKSIPPSFFHYCNSFSWLSALGSKTNEISSSWKRNSAKFDAKHSAKQMLVRTEVKTWINRLSKISTYKKWTLPISHPTSPKQKWAVCAGADVTKLWKIALFIM